jgi:hypothetical protein
MDSSKISNSKHQIPMKSQIPILNDQNSFGIWNFGHCDLEFLVALLPILIMIFVHFVLFVVRLALR